MSPRRSVRKVSNYFANADEDSLDENGNIEADDDGDSYEPEKKTKRTTKKVATSPLKPKNKRSKKGEKVTSTKAAKPVVNDDDTDDDVDWEEVENGNIDLDDVVRPAKKKKSKTSPKRKKSSSLKADKPSSSKPKTKRSKKEDVKKDSDDDDDWEDVEESQDFDLDDYQPSVPENIKVSLDPAAAKSKKKEFSIEHWIRLRMNKMIRVSQLNKHRAHLQALIAHLIFINTNINCDQLRALVLSITSKKVHKFKGKVDKFIDVVYDLISRHFTTLETNDDFRPDDDLVSVITQCFHERSINSILHMAMIVAAMLRFHGYYVRVCATMEPIPFKPKELITKDTKFARSTNSASSSTNNIDNQDASNITYWIEVYDEDTSKWIRRELMLNTNVTIPQVLSYVFAIDNEGYVVDVTNRYASDYLTKTIKARRLEDDWWKETMDIVRRPQDSKYEHADSKEFDGMMSNVALPKRISDFKNHPLFVLQRDILKFQAIYPIDAPPVDFFGEMPVFSRSCVHTLKSRETWLKEARTVKPNEKAYKVVESRFANRRTGRREPLDLFGVWQTKDYEPPVAKDGVVPRNAYGNVEIFKECMLPIGTIRLRLPGLARIASKLKIDCAEAVVGFDAHRARGCHPVFDGFVVCEEYKDVLFDAWREENRNTEQRRKERRQKAVLDNWKRLIKGIIIKHNLQVKYGKR